VLLEISALHNTTTYGLMASTTQLQHPLPKRQLNHCLTMFNELDQYGVLELCNGITYITITEQGLLRSLCCSGPSKLADLIPQLRTLTMRTSNGDYKTLLSELQAILADDLRRLQNPASQ